MKFNIKIAGIYYTATNEYAITYWMRDDRSFAGVSASSSFGENRITVALSGWQETSTKSGCLMSETIDGYWIDITDGWSVTGYNVNYSVSRAQELVSMMQGVRNVYTALQLLTAQSPQMEKIRNAFHPQRCGDIIIEAAPGWTVLNEDTQQRQVSTASFIQFPFIIYGAVTKAERITEPVTIDRIAPTIARSIRIRAPNACSAEPLF